MSLKKEKVLKSFELSGSKKLIIHLHVIRKSKLTRLNILESFLVFVTLQKEKREGNFKFCILFLLLLGRIECDSESSSVLTETSF